MSQWQTHPILCLYHTANQPLRRYLRELLAQQGFFQCDHLELDETVDLAGELLGRAVVLVSAEQVMSAHAQALRSYVRGGGAVVLIAPPDELAVALGLELAEPISANYGVAPFAYARLLDHPDADLHAGTLLQVPTPTRLCKIVGQQTVAGLSARLDVLSNYPSVITVGCGQGEVGVFWFELGAAAVWLRQGDPQRALGPRAGIAELKPGYLFERHMDPHLRQCPQGDVWADVLTHMIQRMAAERLPLPRVWHFPQHAPAVTLLDGDSDLYDWDSYAALAEPARAAGVPYTLNLMARHLDGINTAKLAEYWGLGQDFQLHYWPSDGVVNVETMRAAIAQQSRLFVQVTGRPVTGGRAHSVVWPGYTDVAAALAEHGHQLETNILPFRGWQYGYLGSARPARFLTTAGQFLNVYQQPTVFMDDPMSNDKSLLPACTAEQAYQIVQQYYNDSIQRYHGVICTCLHPVPPLPAYDHYHAVQGAIRQAIIDVTAGGIVPAVTTRQWGAFVHARAQLDLGWHAGRWLLHAPAAISGCTVLLPRANAVAVRTLDLRSGAQVELC